MVIGDWRRGDRASSASAGRLGLGLARGPDRAAAAALGSPGAGPGTAGAEARGSMHGAGAACADRCPAGYWRTRAGRAGPAVAGLGAKRALAAAAAQLPPNEALQPTGAAGASW